MAKPNDSALIHLSPAAIVEQHFTCGVEILFVPQTVHSPFCTYSLKKKRNFGWSLRRCRRRRFPRARGHGRRIPDHPSAASQCWPSASCAPVAGRPRTSVDGTQAPAANIDHKGTRKKHDGFSAPPNRVLLVQIISKD